MPHKMNPEVKAKWVAALRSGAYLQGRTALRSVQKAHEAAERFCCLGVLCEIAVYENIIPPAQFADGCYTYVEDKRAFLPEVVRKWADVEDDSGGFVTINNSLWQLTSHNDNETPFDDIADAIEEQL